MYLLLLLIIVLVISVIVGVFEHSHYSVYGWYISEEKLDKYFEENLELYKRNMFSESMLSAGFILPYLSNSSQSIFSRWSIEDVGIIHKRSKWTKILDEKLAEEKKKHPYKKLFE